MCELILSICRYIGIHKISKIHHPRSFCPNRHYLLPRNVLFCTGCGECLERCMSQIINNHCHNHHHSVFVSQLYLQGPPAVLTDKVGSELRDLHSDRLRWWLGWWWLWWWWWWQWSQEWLSYWVFHIDRLSCWFGCWSSLLISASFVSANPNATSVLPAHSVMSPLKTNLKPE